MRIGVSLYFCAHQRDGVAKSDFMTYPHDFALIRKFYVAILKSPLSLAFGTFGDYRTSRIQVE